jgi:hypothetical protein
MYSGTAPEYKDSCLCLSEEGRRIVEETAELSYLTQITIIRLFDIPSKDIHDSPRFRCEISFSPGALDEASEVIPLHVVLNKHINCAQMLHNLNMPIAAGKSQSGTPKVGRPLSPAIGTEKEKEGVKEGVKEGSAPCPPSASEKQKQESQGLSQAGGGAAPLLYGNVMCCAVMCYDVVLCCAVLGCAIMC